MGRRRRNNLQNTKGEADIRSTSIVIQISNSFLLQYDTTSFAIGAILRQVSEKGEQPVCFAGRALTKTHKSDCLYRNTKKD